MDKTNSSWLKTFSIGFSIISFGITLAIVGYVLTTKQNQTVNQQPTTTSPAVTQLSPIPTVDTTANWKTYTNSVLGYTIKYPDGIKINKLSERDIEIIRVGVPYGGQEGKVATGGMIIYYRGNDGLEKGNDLPGAPSTAISINGYPALKVKYRETGPYVNDIFISDSENKRVVRAAINTAGDAGYEKNAFETFSQILSTFQFSN